MAVAMFLTGVTLLFWPGTLASGNIRPLLQIIGTQELTALCIGVGFLRSITLVLNGRLNHYGPIVRALMGGLSAMIWVMIVAALWVQLDQPSMNTGVFIALAGGELLSIYRAGRDLNAR